MQPLKQPRPRLNQQEQLILNLVPTTRLELVQLSPLPLKIACLPISPRRHKLSILLSSEQLFNAQLHQFKNFYYARSIILESR